MHLVFEDDDAAIVRFMGSGSCAITIRSRLRRAERSYTQNHRSAGH
jgi:hypothetical protein